MSLKHDRGGVYFENVTITGDMSTFQYRGNRVFAESDSYPLANHYRGIGIKWNLQILLGGWVIGFRRNIALTLDWTGV